MDRIQGGIVKGIKFKNTHNFSKKQLVELFSAVNFKEAEFGDKLVISIKNFKTIFSAWDGEKLVGMVCVMDDGILNAYVHYILVHPDYQLKGIGKDLLKRVQSHYEDYLNLVVVSTNDKSRFFEYSGFERIDETILMYVGD